MSKGSLAETLDPTLDSMIRIASQKPSKEGTYELYSFLLNHTQHHFEHQAEFSRCSAFAFLMGQLFAKNSNNNEAFLNEALLLLSDPHVVLPRLKKIQEQMNGLSIPSALKARISLSEDFEVASFYKQRNKILGDNFNQGPLPDYHHLMWHGEIHDPNKFQSKNFGYVEKDYDKTGRHDHFLLNAYTYLYIRKLGDATIHWVVPIILDKIRKLELEAEKHDIENYLEINSRKLSHDTKAIDSFLSGYEEKQRKTLKDAIKRHAVLMERLIKAGALKKVDSKDPSKDVFSSQSSYKVSSRLTRALEKDLLEKQAIEKSLLSEMDMKVNHLGRDFFRHLEGRHFKHPFDVEKWIFNNLCDESELLNKNLIRFSGPLGGHWAEHSAGDSGSLPELSGESSLFVLPLFIKQKKKICEEIMGYRWVSLPIPFIYTTDQDPQTQ